MTVVGFSFYFLPVQAQYPPSNTLALTSEEKAFVDAHPEVVLGGGVSFAPFVMQNEFGEIVGFDKDITDLIQEKTGLTIRFKLGIWKIIQKKARVKELDGLTAAGLSEDKKQYFNATTPYITLTSFIIVKKGNPAKIYSLNDLGGKRAALQEENQIFDSILRPYAENIKVFHFDTLTDVLRSIVSNETDFTILDESAFYLAFTIGLGQFIEAVIPVGPPFDVAFQLRNDRPELVSIFNKGLRGISEEEKLRLRKKWMLSRPIIKDQDRNILLTPEEAAYLDQKGFINVCAAPYYMPYLDIADSRRLNGMAKEYYDLLQKRIGVQFVFLPATSSAEALKMLQNGESDVILMTEIPAGSVENLKFTTPYLNFHYVIATTGDKLFINDFANQLDKSYAVIKGSSVVPKLIRNYPVINLVKVDTISEGLTKLKDGEVFGYIDTYAAIGHAIQKEFISGVKIAGQIPMVLELGAATRRNDSNLASIFQKAVESLTEDDQRKIYNNWIAVKYEKGIDYGLVWKVLLGASLFSGIILIWNRQLYAAKRETHEAIAELSIAQAQLKKKNEELKHLAITDRLTGLFNRMKLDQSLKMETKRFERYGRPVSIILMDIDYFKKINDTYGHQAGDEVLKTVSAILTDNLRQIDVIGRWGGEEFLIICPETDLECACGIAEKLRKTVESHDFGLDIAVTCSFGAAAIASNENDSDFIQKADDALYMAKENGRNRVESARAEIRAPSKDLLSRKFPV